MNWRHKVVIGATGGIALVLLKLIEVEFFVDDINSKRALAAYMTYAAYILLGIIVAVFFTDDSLEEAKRKKSAFLAGLMAPSVLLAILHSPVQGKGLADTLKPDLGPIPKITGLFVGSAYAQPNPDSILEGTTQFLELKKDQVEPRFVDGFKLAIGRGEPTKNLVYVLGQTDSKYKALSVATNVNKFLSAATGSSKTTANVLQPEGSNSWYVTVGTVGSASDTAASRNTARSAAIEALTATGAVSKYKPEAKLILEGKVVNAATLFAK